MVSLGTLISSDEESPLVASLPWPAASAMRGVSVSLSCSAPKRKVGDMWRDACERWGSPSVLAGWMDWLVIISYSEWVSEKVGKLVNWIVFVGWWLVAVCPAFFSYMSHNMCCCDALRVHHFHFQGGRYRWNPPKTTPDDTVFADDKHVAGWRSDILFPPWISLDSTAFLCQRALWRRKKFLAS